MQASALNKRKQNDSPSGHVGVKKQNYDRKLDITYLGHDAWQYIASFLPPINRMALVRAFPDIPELKKWIPSQWWNHVPEKVREVIENLKKSGVECYFTGSGLLKSLTGAKWEPSDYDIVICWKDYIACTDSLQFLLHEEAKESPMNYPDNGMVKYVYDSTDSRNQYIILMHKKDIDQYVDDFAHTGVKQYCSSSTIIIKRPSHLIKSHFVVTRPTAFRKIPEYRRSHKNDLRCMEVFSKTAWLVHYFHFRGYTGERADGNPWPQKLADFWDMAGGWPDHNFDNMAREVLQSAMSRIGRPGFAIALQDDLVKEEEETYAKILEKQKKMAAKV